VKYAASHHSLNIATIRPHPTSCYSLICSGNDVDEGRTLAQAHSGPNCLAQFYKCTLYNGTAGIGSILTGVRECKEEEAAKETVS